MPIINMAVGKRSPIHRKFRALDISTPAFPKTSQSASEHREKSVRILVGYASFFSSNDIYYIHIFEKSSQTSLTQRAMLSPITPSKLRKVESYLCKSDFTFPRFG